MLKWLICALCACSFYLNAEINILAFSGSTRDDSLNKKLVSQAALMARQMGANVRVIDLKNFSSPFYDGDLEAKQGMPQKMKELRKLMIESQAIMIASPEYNGSLSAVLKNAIDWSSRSEDGKPSREAFNGKKFAIMSVSPGPGGGSRGLTQLRSILENVGGVVISKQVAVPNGFEAFNAKGELKNYQTQQELKQLVQQLISP